MNETELRVALERAIDAMEVLRVGLSLRAPDAIAISHEGVLRHAIREARAALATPPAPAGDDSPCVFVPAIEWTCTTHEGFRTSLNEDRCRGRGGRRRTDTAALDVEALLDAMSIVHRYPEAGGMNHREMGEAYAREYEKLREGSLHPIAVTR